MNQNQVRTPHVFPGLWIDANALFASDYQQLMKIVDAGMATKEYAQFRDKLAIAARLRD